jgi:pyridoxal phosphate enzyme (YggS family)
MSIHERLPKIIQSVDKYGINLLSPGHGPILLAASKGQAEAIIEEAITAGITHFGENRVQEAQGKWEAIKARHPDITLHLIGPLQTNKVADAVALFDVIQTLDRPKLADALAAAMARTGKNPPCFIQVNTGNEPQKAGVIPEEADAFIDYCIKEKKLSVRGLMCIPPDSQPPAPHFALLKTIAERHGLKELSMGMSNDYETALRMGATIIRLGRILFGERA